MSDRMKFERTPDGQVRPKGLIDELGRVPTASDLIARSNRPDGPPRSADDIAITSRMVQAKADYKAKSRAEALLSRQVVARHSPSARIKIVTPEDSPFAFRFCFGPRRERVTMKGWEPVTDMELAKRICPSAYLRMEADGKIYSGDSFLCKKPKEAVEDNYALYFQRSQRNMLAASRGKSTALQGDGTSPGDAETFDDLHRQTVSRDDPVGVRLTVKQDQGLLDT